MDISVVVCTYNRAGLLPRTLEGLNAQEAPRDLRWELVVVDNNSTDGTREVIERFIPQAPMPVSHVFEPEQGISAARNTGIAHARGEVIAFTDDDVRPAPDWVAMVGRVQRESGADLIGGRILPDWSGPVPRWLRDEPELAYCLAIMEHDKAERVVSTSQPGQIWGANFAARRSLFERIGMFDTRLGQKGAKLYRGEDSDLVRRAIKAGCVAIYDPRLVVWHLVETERMRRSYFRRHAFETAEGQALNYPPPGRRRLFGAPLFAYRHAVTRLVVWLMAAAGRRHAFARQLDFAAALGRLWGQWRANRGRGGEAAP